MLRRLAALVPILLASVVHAEPLRMDITLNGSPVGESVYESDGSKFNSRTVLAVGSVKLESSANGEFRDGRLIRLESTSKAPAGTVVLTLADGKLTIDRAGKKDVVPFEDKAGAHIGNLHPQFTATAILAAERALATTPAAKETTVPAFMIDGGATIPTRIASLGTKLVTVNGSPQRARRFSVQIGNVATECVLNDANQVVAQDVPSQKIRFLVAGWEGLFEDPMKVFPELSQATFKTVTERGVKIRMRDGVELVADVIRPEAPGKYPAILVRTPYGRGSETTGAGFYAPRGYVYIAQDCRGREDSGGEWDPFVHEGADGKDTIDWIAKQTWSDGKVGMIGGSYAGYVQWAAAVERPEALKCIVPQVSPPDAMRNIPFDHGIFALYADVWWAKIVAGKKTDFSGLGASLPNPAGFTTLPLEKVDEAVLKQDLPFFNRWLERPTLRDWRGFDYTSHLRNARVPALHISGTWDGDEIGTQINWRTLRKLGRKDQWILFGPWTHAFNTTDRLGDTVYGPGAILELDSLYLRWFDTWLKGKEVGLAKVPRAKVFVTGANAWREMSDWPSPASRKQRLYFAKDALVAKAGPADEATYTYDPVADTDIPKQLLNPDPAQATTKVNPADLAPGRSLLLKSEPFAEDADLSTPFEVTLKFRSNAEDTDFFLAPVDIAPDGTMRVVGQVGKVRASYLGGMDRRIRLKKGKVYTAKFGTWDFAHRFAKGHRLGILLSSSGFPMYARNLGYVDDVKTATRMTPQTNTILMGRGGSFLEFQAMGK